MYLRVCEIGKEQAFRADERDISYVSYQDIIKILPPPEIIQPNSKMFYKFKNNIEVFEQK